MTKAEELDWIYRLRSNIYVYMPKEWLIPMNNALDMAIKALEQQPCEVCRNCKKWDECPCGKEGHENGTSIGYSIGECKDYEPCEMTAEEYRQRMIQAFHNADCDELIAVCVLPAEKEFEHLEWLLKKKHYKKEPSEDKECI